MKQFAEKLKRVSLRGWIFGIFLFFLGFGIYRLGKWLSFMTGTAERAFVCKIPMIDDRIPLIPCFVVIYILAYVMWVIAFAMITGTKKRNFINFLCAYLLSMLTGFIFFIFLPTYMDRTVEGLTTLSQEPGLFNWMLRIVYQGDGGTQAFNLFPSFHCISSVFAYLGVRNQEEIPGGIQLFFLIGGILICLSAVFTKQHFFIDIVSGLLISLFWYFIILLADPGKRFENRA